MSLPPTIRAVFFDLDDTLCDAKPAFELAVAAAFATIRGRHPNLNEAVLHRAWRAEHGPLFADLATGKRTMAEVRGERFRRLLSRLEVADDAFADDVDQLLGQMQLSRLRLFPDHGVLDELRRRGLHVGIVTNGAGDDHPDSQRSKAAHLGLLDRVDSFWVSDEIGYRKPDRRAFLPALNAAGCEPDEAMYIGDSIDNDIAGANDAGLTTVLLWRSTDLMPVPHGEHRPHHVVRSLRDLPSLIPTT